MQVTTNATHKLCHLPVASLSFQSSIHTLLFLPLGGTGCWNHSVDRRFLFFLFGCLLQIRSDCLGSGDCYSADVAILEVPLLTWASSATLLLHPTPPPGGKVWKNQVTQLFFFFFEEMSGKNNLVCETTNICSTDAGYSCLLNAGQGGTGGRGTSTMVTASQGDSFRFVLKTNWKSDDITFTHWSLLTRSYPGDLGCTHTHTHTHINTQQSN